jgi:hypothetical protein
MQNLSESTNTPLPRREKTPKEETTAGELIAIRIHHSLLLPSTPNAPAGNLDASHATASGPSPSPPHYQSHLYVIKGTFDDIKLYAGETVDWLIKIANFIFDPSGLGRLYTHTTGKFSDWHTLERTHSWREVVHGDPLHAGIYEFVSNISISLSKISERRNYSVTTAGSESNANAFSRLIRLRDGNACVVTRIDDPDPLVASHLIPKRLGTEGATGIVTRFCGAQQAIGIHRFDPRIGILLSVSLDRRVDVFEVGFYHNSVNSELSCI